MHKLDEYLKSRIDEIIKLYGLTTVEVNCLTQMSLMIELLGYHPDLRVKLIKALAAIDEIILDEIKKCK